VLSTEEVATPPTVRPATSALVTRKDFPARKRRNYNL
jgi:hypothetical protein